MTTTLTAEELAEIEARANAATPGPWEQTDGNIWIDTREMVCCGRGYYGCCGDPDILGGQEIFAQSNPTDANFIAHARADIPALLASHKAQAAEIERLTREVEKEGRAHSITIDQRDAAEEALGNAYTIITGQVPEWSNLFDYNAALLEIEEAAARAIAAEAKVAALEKTLNTPEVFDFVKAVQLEAAHQRERWGTEHDAGKTDADWFWLVGYLAGKALHNPANDMPTHEAQLHRIVATAAALANWHLAKLGLTNMRPGIEPPVDAALGAKP